MFIRRKVVNGVTYYAVVENQRPRSDEDKPRRWKTARDGRVKQRTVVSLGQHLTIEAALQEARQAFAAFQAKANIEHARHLARMKWESDSFKAEDYRVRQGFRAQKEADKWKWRIVKLEAAQAVVSNK